MTTRSAAVAACVALAVLAACQASTTRPTFGPLPGPLTGEVRLSMAAATETLAEALRADSVALRRVYPRDGVVESDWLQVPGYAVTGARRLGPGIVRVRGWVDPGKPFHSVYTVEVAFRAYADPSREERELEQPVAQTHPARIKVARVLERIVVQYGDSAAVAAITGQLPRPEPPLKPDTLRRDRP